MKLVQASMLACALIFQFRAQFWDTGDNYGLRNLDISTQNISPMLGDIHKNVEMLASDVDTRDH